MEMFGSDLPQRAAQVFETAHCRTLALGRDGVCWGTQSEAQNHCIFALLLYGQILVG